MADVEIDLQTSNPQELIGKGIRAYAIGDFSNAAAAFGRATQLMAEKNGDEHDSLGEVYIQYARSLLEVSREESGPLGDAIPQEEEESDSEEDVVEESADNKTEKMEEGTVKDEEKTESNEEKKDTDKTNEEKKDIEQNDGEMTSEDKDKEKKIEDKDDVKNTANSETEAIRTPKKDQIDGEDKKENGDVSTEKEKANGETSGENTKEGTSKDEETTNGEDEEPENCSDLQLAWEVLEVAKKIFTKRGTSGKDHLADTLILLGEIAMESENFQDGINDMKAGLELQKEIFEPTSRKLAETYYKLGAAQSTITETDEAVESFKKSIEILTNRIKFLKESAKEITDSVKTNRNNEEIEEMEKLILEIEEKIADTKLAKEEMAAKLLAEMTDAIVKQQKPAATEEASSSKPKDISHLVKRKRKADDEPSAPESQPAKKPTP